ncbi:MAG: hypothetical protein AB7R55_06245 [Gemmatimonadales bacterium]
MIPRRFGRAAQVAALALGFLGPSCGVEAPRHPIGGRPPRFENYPSEPPFTGRPALPDLSSHPDASRFGAALWQGARRGPDFAGRYKIVSRRCGRLCREFAIVDAATGRVHGGLADTPPFHYRLDSRLIVFDAPAPLEAGTSCPGCTAAYYVWNDPRLDPVPPEAWADRRPPPAELRPLLDSLRSAERPLLARAGPSVTRASWDRLVISARDGTRRVLSDSLRGRSLARLHRYLGEIASIEQFLVEVHDPLGRRYLAIDVESGALTELDTRPIVSPTGDRFVTASPGVAGLAPSRLRIYRVGRGGPTLEWSSDGWGGTDAVWLDRSTLAVERPRGTGAPGERVVLRLVETEWVELRLPTGAGSPAVRTR